MRAELEADAKDETSSHATWALPFAPLHNQTSEKTKAEGQTNVEKERPHFVLFGMSIGRGILMQWGSEDE